MSTVLLLEQKRGVQEDNHACSRGYNLERKEEEEEMPLLLLLNNISSASEDYVESSDRGFLRIVLIFH